jgi:cysteinyl-tRNA synthetase
MTLKFHNTLTKKKEEFKEIEKGKVGYYACGPTVYDYAHIGNFRTFVFNDLLRRYLKYKKYEVKEVMNLTDVDDKTIKGSQKANLSLKDFTDKFAKYFVEDLKTLNIEMPEIMPSAVAHVKEMVKMIQTLLEKDIAYKGDDGSIYYSVEKAKDYGKFAGLDLENLKAGARVSHDEYDKENVADFALWKAWDKDDGDVYWETDLGKGRPGWHIECSAMSTKYLGSTFDIHTGGEDLIFPHHQNEIAQSEGATGKKFVNYWIHVSHLIVEGKKMSKSLGNFFTLRDLLEKGKDPLAIRYLLLSTHYRQQLNFTMDGIDAAHNSLERLNNFMIMLRNANGDSKQNVDSFCELAKKKFEDAMDDDLSISDALAHVFDFVREINSLENLSKNDALKVIKTMIEIDSVLGVISAEEVQLSEEEKELVDERQAARKNKDYAKADTLRALLEEKGILLEDTIDGFRIKRK